MLPVSDNCAVSDTYGPTNESPEYKRPLTERTRCHSGIARVTAVYPNVDAAERKRDRFREHICSFVSIFFFLFYGSLFFVPFFFLHVFVTYSLPPYSTNTTLLERPSKRESGARARARCLNKKSRIFEPSLPPSHATYAFSSRGFPYNHRASYRKSNIHRRRLRGLSESKRKKKKRKKNGGAGAVRRQNKPTPSFPSVKWRSAAATVYTRGSGVCGLPDICHALVTRARRSRLASHTSRKGRIEEAGGTPTLNV